MAGGGMVASSGGTVYEAKITPILIISCIMAATGGLMFGYDIGVSGGVTSMDDFLKKFFPPMYEKILEEENSNYYCKYDSAVLQLFTSSFYLAGLTVTFLASYTTRRLGRRITMLIAGIFSIIGVVVNTAAQDLAMLIAGRILLGCGVGFANQKISKLDDELILEYVAHKPHPYDDQSQVVHLKICFSTCRRKKAWAPPYSGSPGQRLGIDGTGATRTLYKGWTVPQPLTQYS